MSSLCKNQGANNVERIQVTVTSSNPHVTFPFGNSFQFPPVHKYGTSTGSIAVAVNGAAAVDSTDFTISVSAPEFGLPSGVTYTSTQRLNYDEKPASSATETVEASNPAGWTVSGGAPTIPNILGWQRRTLSATSHVWFGPDNNGQNDGVRPDGPDEQSLISPTMHVGY